MSKELQNTNLPDGCIMTLKNVVDTINKARKEIGKTSFLEHGKAIKTILKLSETPSFGEVEFFSTSYTNNIGASLPLKTLALNKKQAISSAAKLDNSMLMQVIDRVEELESDAKSKAVALPNFEDPAEAAIAWAKEYKGRKAAELESELKDKRIAKKDNIILDVADLNRKAGNILIGQFANNIAIKGLGQNNLFKWLKQKGYLQRNRRPHRDYVERGYFVEKPSDEEFGGKVRYTTMLTPKGTIWLTRVIKEKYNKGDK